jgi:hypothetical protein
MFAAAANSYKALLTLVLNSYGHDAMKIAWSIYEIELNVLWRHGRGNPASHCSSESSSDSDFDAPESLATALNFHSKSVS